MRTLFLDLICVAVLCVILTLGLWPFHSPKNQVTWLGNHNGLRFGKCGTAFSSSAFQMTKAESGASGSVEVWLQPRRIWDSGTFLAFYNPGNLHQFSLRQSDVDLELQAEIRDGPHPPDTASLYVRNAFRRSGPVFLTITSGIHGTAVYTDGVLARTAAQFRHSAKEFTGRLVLGDSPGQPDSWSGELLGLAIYRRELTPTQVLRHYVSWTHGDPHEISEDELNIALYRFGERAGNVVHNQAGAGVNLYIPERCSVLDKIFLEPVWKEFSMSRSYWGTFPKNIVGFIPFGFCFCACLSARKVRRAALVTVILGTLVSLAIEILQAYLPTRDSGMTDIFTNTLGTYVGVIGWRVVSPILAARFSWLAFVARR
ncbi:MAG TPA: VanZ family protein [Terriglobales bacterium]|nr:VanZ family protein [Terriglobales bacterium]